MAVYFDGSNDALVNTAWPVVDLTDGLTLACWFKVPAVATTRALFGISDSSSPYYSLYLQLDSSTLAAYTTDATNYNNANKTGAAANVWSLACGTYPSISSRTAWLNGSPGTAQTTSRTCLSLDRITIGKRYYNGNATFGQANLAHVAVWRATLTAAEIEWLYDGGRGISPTLIRPDALICHYPLVEDFNCSSGPLHLTREDSPLWTNDSERILLPRRRFFWRPEWTSPPAGGDVTVAPAAATAVAASVNPTVVLGSITYPPAARSAVAATVNPTVVLGSISYPPVASSAVAATVNPTVVISGGGVEVAPAAATAVAASVNPTVVLGSITYPPAARSAVAATVNPTVVIGGGGISVEPSAATAVAATVNPTVVLGSISYPPAASSAVAATVNPTVEISGGGLMVTPQPAAALAAVFGPTVFLSSTTATPGPATAIAATVNPIVDDGGELVTGVIASAIAETYGPFVFTALGAESATMSIVIPKAYHSDVVHKPYQSTVIPRHTETEV